MQGTNRSLKKPHVPTIDHSEESTLIRRAQEGDADAAAELYNRHVSAIYRYFYFRVNESAVAEDLTGEVFLKMTEGLPRFNDRGVPLAAWLFRIAHDRLIDYRRATRRPIEELSEAIVDNGADPETWAGLRMDSNQLSQEIASLTDEQKTVIQLRFIEGYSLEDTARLMGKTVGAVKAMQHRALQTLARKLDL
ncbi:MAG: sigma-70 family RNA polymerase sigma factor [Chloroflexi bacterium]|nr:sigma-70 family RNA polymerase sigma factor [Chloroflexota bacterium]